MTVRSSILLFSMALFAASLAVGVGHAAAEPGPIELISKSNLEQAPDADEPAISTDGRYVAFRGEVGGLEGVFRKDLETGAIAPVSAGSVIERPKTVSASAPSISADGRYVSFTTEAPLDPLDDKAESSRDVYVADMATTPPTYELASALNDSAVGLSYGTGGGGSIASGGIALSADGREVVFVTTLPSNFSEGPAEAEGPVEETETPAGQVFIRNLERQETTLVSATRDPLTGVMTEQPVPGGAVSKNESVDVHHVEPSR